MIKEKSKIYSKMPSTCLSAWPVDYILVCRLWDKVYICRLKRTILDDKKKYQFQKIFLPLFHQELREAEENVSKKAILIVNKY